MQHRSAEKDVVITYKVDILIAAHTTCAWETHLILEKSHWNALNWNVKIYSSQNEQRFKNQDIKFYFFNVLEILNTRGLVTSNTVPSFEKRWNLFLKIKLI